MRFPMCHASCFIQQPLLSGTPCFAFCMVTSNHPPPCYIQPTPTADSGGVLTLSTDMPFEVSHLSLCEMGHMLLYPGISVSYSQSVCCISNLGSADGSYLISPMTGSLIHLGGGLANALSGKKHQPTML